MNMTREEYWAEVQQGQANGVDVSDENLLLILNTYDGESTIAWSERISVEEARRRVSERIEQQA